MRSSTSYERGAVSDFRGFTLLGLWLWWRWLAELRRTRGLSPSLLNPPAINKHNLPRRRFLYSLFARHGFHLGYRNVVLFSNAGVLLPAGVVDGFGHFPGIAFCAHYVQVAGGGFAYQALLFCGFELLLGFFQAHGQCW